MTPSTPDPSAPGEALTLEILAARIRRYESWTPDCRLEDAIAYALTELPLGSEQDAAVAAIFVRLNAPDQTVWRPMSEAPFDRPIIVCRQFHDGSWSYMRTKVWYHEHRVGLYARRENSPGKVPFLGPFDGWCEITTPLDGTATDQTAEIARLRFVVDFQARQLRAARALTKSELDK